MPTNINELMNFINTIKSGNPQQTMINMLQQKAQNNPMFNDILNYAQAGDTQHIEQIVRNMAKEKGFDYDKEFNSFRQMFGL